MKTYCKIFVCGLLLLFQSIAYASMTASLMGSDKGATCFMHIGSDSDSGHHGAMSESHNHCSLCFLALTHPVINPSNDSVSFIHNTEALPQYSIDLAISRPPPQKS